LSARCAEKYARCADLTAYCAESTAQRAEFKIIFFVISFCCILTLSLQKNKIVKL